MLTRVSSPLLTTPFVRVVLEQISSEDLEALALHGKRLTCTAECLENGGLWCSAMGING